MRACVRAVNVDLLLYTARNLYLYTVRVICLFVRGLETDGVRRSGENLDANVSHGR